MSQRKRLSAIMGTPVLSDEPQRPSPETSTPYTPLADANGPAATPEKRSGAARSMAAMWIASTAGTAEADGAVVELDPDLCDPSAIADRVPDATDAGFERFALAIRDEGQHTPILVRRKPADPGRYEIAYGRRRTRVAKALGRTVRAIVRDLSDAELVVAQGSENLARQDLSYIERAHFAHNMARAGVARDVILRAMGTDKGDLSRYLTVAESIPAEMLAAIGPAPKVGRPRWVTLADRIRSARPDEIAAALASPGLPGRSSDERFAAVLAALSGTSKSKVRPRAESLKDGHGVKFARVERSAMGLRLTVAESVAPGFGDYLADRLPEILAAYRAGKA
ncbi:Nucleoid occlusion protein [Methylobacterium crusticola]|uniref:Nucleoid occlusion protein n=1 Tax=Methylobacterium crusticola TaxID=1697972 RepID=A0ABQ4R6L8_9HYPH|nr:plasmid partitioning protein RepB [Methylobacterium crusticola]GJD53367.1 Nucleoid occlusion protein [Methylobacterium crusticola]